MNQFKTDEVVMRKLFLVLQYNLPLVPLGSDYVPRGLVQDAVRDFGSLEEARDFAKSEQSKWDSISIYSKSSEPLKTRDGERYFKRVERYQKDGSVYIRCPECSFEYGAGKRDILEAHWAGHHKHINIPDSGE